MTVLPEPAVLRLTLRTVPRSDGQTSVVLTRDPASPDDPEVLGVFKTAKAAMTSVLQSWAAIAKQSGRSIRTCEHRSRVDSDGDCSVTVSMILE